MTYLLDGFEREMRAIGLGDEHLRMIFVTNPARAFAFIAR
jgi:predicted metal-dependent phosphotriesterase family hydrolase